MAELGQAVKSFANRLIVATADELVSDIQSNWSTSSPSSPGEAPAVVSGELNASVHREGDTVVVDAPYAGELEYGGPDKVARPFVRPAVRRVASRIGEIAVRVG